MGADTGTIGGAGAGTDAEEGFLAMFSSLVGIFVA
jgi:hypothetical protein